MAPEGQNRADLVQERVTSRAEPFDDSPRSRTLAAVVEVVAHGGYRDATVDRVLERAHVSWREFTELFGDLDACVLAALDAGMECAARHAREAAANVPEGTGIDATFEAALRAVLESAAAHPDLTRLCLVDATELGAAALERRERGLQRFVDLLEQRLGPATGTAGRGAPRGLTTEMVVGGIHELLQRKARAGEVEDLPALADELRRLWLPVLRGA